MSYTHMSTSNNTLNLNPDFANKNVLGYQSKGLALLNNKPFFIKLDSINPSSGKHWLDNFNYMYSSVSESLVSLLINNIKNLDMRSANYDFWQFNINGKMESGTISNIYLKEHEVEIILSDSRSNNTNNMIDIDTFASEIFDVSAEKRLNNLIKIVSKYGVNETHAKKFFIDQIALDILTSNQDRMQNPSNVAIAYNTKTNKGQLINFDFGRCLPINWSHLMEEKLTIGDEFYNDDIESNTRAAFANNDSLISSLTRSEQLDFLANNGFEKFQVSTNVINDLLRLQSNIEKTDLTFKKFAHVKIDSFINMLQSDYASNFIDFI